MNEKMERRSEMKRMTNLIFNMCSEGATEEELERAVLYWADVVQAGKSDVDWKQSYEDYVIVELLDKYYPDAMGCDCDKDYIVFSKNYTNDDGTVSRGILLAGFDTKEEAEDFVKEMNSPSLIILGPKEK